MAIRHGQILHDAHGFVVDRIQSGGVNSLNVPIERVNELGNYQTVATVRDIPDLSFEVQSLDVSTEMEAIALRLDPTATVEGQEFDFNKAIPIDIISPFKAGQGLFAVVAGIALPYLTLENVTYRYGIRSNAEQTFTFKGDSIFYIPGTPYYDQAVKSGADYTFDHTALLYNDAVGNDVYAVGVCWYDPATNLYGRLFHGQDYTDTSAGFTIGGDALALIPTGAIITWCYGSAAAGEYLQAVHQDVSVKPAAVRGRHIDIYVASGATPVMQRWTSVQSFEASRRVTLDPNQEFGNSQYVSQDYDVPAVSGNLVVRPRDVTDLFDKINEITNTPSSEIAGALSSQSVAMEARIYDPTATVPTVLKTIYCPDARFTPPAIQGRVGQKLEPTLPFESDSGVMLVYQGERPS